MWLVKIKVLPCHHPKPRNLCVKDTQEGVVLQKTHVYYIHTDVKVGNWATIGKKGNTYYWDVVFGVDPDPDLNWFCK